MKSKKSLIVRITAVLIIILAIVAIILNDRSAAKESYAIPASGTVVYDASYQGYLEQYGFDGTIQDSEVQVEMDNYTAADGMTAENADDGLITGDSGSVTWTFDVLQEGFYNLEIGYIATPGTMSDIQRRLFINGEIGHSGLEQIVFKRYWYDDAIKEKNGNEIRPDLNEVYKETRTVNQLKNIYFIERRIRIAIPK